MKSSKITPKPNSTASFRSNRVRSARSYRISHSVTKLEPSKRSSIKDGDNQTWTEKRTKHKRILNAKGTGCAKSARVTSGGNKHRPRRHSVRCCWGVASRLLLRLPRLRRLHRLCPSPSTDRVLHFLSQTRNSSSCLEHPNIFLREPLAALVQPRCILSLSRGCATSRCHSKRRDHAAGLHVIQALLSPRTI